MMRRVEGNTIWGVLLVVGGLLFLFQNLGLLGDAAATVWALLFAAAGLAFLGMVVYDRQAWWAVIPGGILLALGVLIGVEQLFPRVERDWGGPFFLAAIGVTFWAVYALDRVRWWAIIPAGTLTTLAVVAALPDVLHGPLSGGVFFLGLALTFGLVSLAPSPVPASRQWALWPAAACLTLGVVAATGGGRTAQWLWPLALIGVGLYLVLRRQQTPQQ